MARFGLGGLKKKEVVFAFRFVFCVHEVANKGSWINNSYADIYRENILN